MAYCCRSPTLGVKGLIDTVGKGCFYKNTLLSLCEVYSLCTDKQLHILFLCVVSISKCWYNTYKGLSDRESIDWRSFGICFAGLCFVPFQLLLAWSDYLFWQLKTNDNFVLSPRATYEKYSYKGKIFKEIREILTEKVHAVKKSPTPALTFLMTLSLRVSVPAPWGISPTFQMSYLISLYYPPTTSALIIFSFKYLVILVVPGSPRINLHLYCNGFCEGLF